MNEKVRRSVFFVAVILLFGFPILAHSQSAPLLRRTLLSQGFTHQSTGIKVAFFDADSTLRVSKSGSVSANAPDDVQILPWVETKIRDLNKKGFLIAIVSNQGGVEQGVITAQVADQALKYTIDQIGKLDREAIIHYFDFAEGDGPDRKPGRGMADRLDGLLKAQTGSGIDWTNSFMVGDSAYKKGVDLRPDGSPGTHFSNSDRLFAEAIGVPFEEPADFFGWRRFGVEVFEKLKEVEDFNAGNPRPSMTSGSCRTAFQGNAAGI